MLPAEEIIAAVVEAAEHWSGGPGPNIALVGAEPFAHPALPQLIASAVDAGCERIRLRTDGGALAGSGNAAGALHAGVRHVELVALGGDAATHDRLSGRPGLFDAMMAGTASYAQTARSTERSVAITGHIPVCRHTAPQLSATVRALARMGAVSVLVEPVNGFAPPASVVSDGQRAATVSGVAIHGPGFAPFAAEPWRVAEARQ
jgi:MoaA/NifB/PqqE/SkfB family radical SAM enzyme